jgi:hypothetical protein
LLKEKRSKKENISNNINIIWDNINTNLKDTTEAMENSSWSKENNNRNTL